MIFKEIEIELSIQQHFADSNIKLKCLLILKEIILEPELHTLWK